MANLQKAAILPGKHGKVEVGTRPIPSPGNNEVLVKVKSAAINPVDWKIIDHELIPIEYPGVLGTDGAGVIESVGPGVTGLQKGDRVFFQGRYVSNFATFQQYAIADSELISKTPKNISDDQASTIPVASIAPLLGLFQKSGVAMPLNEATASGKPLLIIGGSSSVGQYAIQLARIAGFSPIVTTASGKHVEHLKTLGATHVLDRNADAKTIQSAFPTPVAQILDAISSPSTQSFGFEVLTTPSPVPGAYLGILLNLDEGLKKKNDALGSAAISINEAWGLSHLHRDQTRPFWRILENWIESGRYVPNRVQVVPGGLSGVVDGLELSKKGVSGVKLVIHPQE